MLTVQEIEKVPQGFRDLVDVVRSVDVTRASGRVWFEKHLYDLTLEKDGTDGYHWKFNGRAGNDLFTLAWKIYTYDKVRHFGDVHGSFRTDVGRWCLLYFIDKLREAGTLSGAPVTIQNDTQTYMPIVRYE